MIALLSCSVSGWSDAHYPVDWDWHSSAMGRCHENILYADCCLSTLVAITTPTIGVSKMKLWWKSFFLQKCKVQVNTSSWHSQLCGLLLWHSAKVLTGFIKSFISKLYKKGKMVVGVWRKVSNICEASFPDRPQLSTYRYPVQRGVQCPGQCPHSAISTLILSSHRAHNHKVQSRHLALCNFTTSFWNL